MIKLACRILVALATMALYAEEWTTPPRNEPEGPNGRYVPTYPSVHPAATSVARPVPAFLKGAVIYQLFTRMFTPEGTFKAAERKLPELKDLGIDIIYLTPHQLADDDCDQRNWSERQRQCGFGNAKNPYRQKDYYAVDSEYGTAQDLRDFVASAHCLGMRVLFDLVYFHCGPKAVFLDDHPDFIVRNSDGSPKLGDWAFPELDFRNPALREYLYDNMTGFVRDYGVDGFRCDVADMLPVAFWEEGARRCRAIRPDIVFMCEGLKGDDQIEAFDLSYGFYTQWALVDILAGKKPASELRKAWTVAQGDFPKGFHWMRCFENHDFANCSPGEKRKEELFGHKLNAAMLATVFLLDGVPMLYNGQEIADASPHSIFSNRHHGGLHIDWTRAEDDAANERRTLVKRLTELRHGHPALFDAPLEWLETGVPEKAYAFRRVLPEGSITLSVNVTDGPVDIVVDGTRRKLEAHGFLLEDHTAHANETANTVAAVKALKDGETLRFAPGVHHFYRDGAERIALSPSNNMSGEKDVLFPVVGKKNVTIDGGGSTFVFHDGTFPFAVVGSEGVTISNFTATTGRLPYAPFEVVEKSAEGFRIRFGADAPARRCENGRLVFLREDGEISSVDTRFSIHALDRVGIRYLFVGDSNASKEGLPAPFVAADAEDADDGEVLMRYRAPSGHPQELREFLFALGEPLAVNLEQRREHVLVFADSSERVTFEDIRAERVAGMAFVAQMCGDVAARRVMILPRDRERVSATADGFQFVNCYGKLVLEDCEVGWTMDDALNMHGNYLLVEGTAGRVASLRIGHYEQSGFFPFRPGDRVLFREPKRRTVVGEAKVVALGEPSADSMRAKLTVDRELPVFPVGTLVEAVSRYPDAHITRCHTHDQLSIRISGGGRVRFDHNRIGSGYCGLQINDMPKFWFESGPVSSVIVEDNDFENCTSRVDGGGPFISVGVSGFKPGDPDTPRIHKGIVIRNNRFVGATGNPVRLNGVADDGTE